MPLSQVQQDILSILKKANHVLLFPSSPLDGDSIGSVLALYMALKKLGKKATVVAEETVPASYNFLPEISAVSHELKFVRDFIVTIDCRDVMPGNVRHEIQGNKINIIVTPANGVLSKDSVAFSQGPVPYDCIVTVDAADVSQFGKIYENFAELWGLIPVINIDHHASNSGFGKINHVDIMAPAASTMVLPLIEELGPNLMDADIATLILAGLITDTGSFQNPNTTPDAFSIAAKLIGYGARQQEIIRNVYKTKKLSTLRLWGRTLTKLQYDESLHLVWSVLTAKDFAEIGGSPDETEGVIDELMSNAPGAEIIFLLKEKGPMESGGSIRTLTPTIDASKLAALFGGGGHTQAAGFKMQKNITEAEQAVVAALKDFQQKRLGIETPVMPSAPMSVPPASRPSPPPPPTPTPTPSTPPPPRLIAEPPSWPPPPSTPLSLPSSNFPFPPQPGMMG